MSQARTAEVTAGAGATCSFDGAGAMSVTAGSEHTITGAGDGGRGSHVFIRWSKRRVGDGRLERRMRLAVAYRQSVPSYCPRCTPGGFSRRRSVGC